MSNAIADGRPHGASVRVVGLRSRPRQAHRTRDVPSRWAGSPRSRCCVSDDTFDRPTKDRGTSPICPAKFPEQCRRRKMSGETLRRRTLFTNAVAVAAREYTKCQEILDPLQRERFLWLSQQFIRVEVAGSRAQPRCRAALDLGALWRRSFRRARRTEKPHHGGFTVAAIHAAYIGFAVNRRGVTEAARTYARQLILFVRILPRKGEAGAEKTKKIRKVATMPRRRHCSSMIRDLCAEAPGANFGGVHRRLFNGRSSENSR